MENNQYSYNFVNLLKFIVRWWKHLAVLTAIAMIVSLGISFLVTPKFKSKVVFYPSTNNSISNALLPGITGKEKDVLQFGAEEEAEQLLQLLNSENLKWEIIERYNLMEHYGIDPKGAFPFTRLSLEFDNNIRYRRTEYASIEIAVLDKDPQRAADIANGIANLLDTVKSNMQRELAVQALAIVEGHYLKQKKLVEQIQDTLKELGAKGVFNYEEQSTALAEAAAKSMATGGINAKLQAQIDTLSKYGGTQMSFQEGLKLEVTALADLRMKYEKAKVDAESFLPSKFVVNSAGPAERKAYPKRWLLMLIGGGSTFFMALLILIGLENFRKYDIIAQVKDKGATSKAG